MDGRMSKIRILLTDDHTLFRQAIRTMLSAEPDIEVMAKRPTPPKPSP